VLTALGIASSRQASATSPARPPELRRLKSDDLKRAVNQVLMPKLLAHQNTVSKAKAALRRGSISPANMRSEINESSRAFDTRYAEALRAAAALAHELPPGADFPLRRLVSSDESWEVLCARNAELGLGSPRLPAGSPVQDD
jgi:hypothetical protein